jgi:hypothetical protein
VITAERLAARRAEIGANDDLSALRDHIERRNAPVLARTPVIPEVKALLSMDGGVCPDDGSTLQFDPWSPDEHQCPRCQKRFRGERHHRAWAKRQHLWLAERAVELATLAAVAGHEAAGRKAAELLRAYGERYFRYPNQDNVLGPSRLFFSTYLESLWVLNYVTAAHLLRGAGALDEATAKAVHVVADEAANLIGEYDERFSNRQTWNNAALCAIAVWFEDEDLARRAIESPTGLVAHLRGYGRDGLWFEGENYHLFALRGLLAGAGWAALAGVDLAGDPATAAALAAALRAPALTALPDLTFPARKDARFGISLAQPMYVEIWEVGLGKLGSGEAGDGNEELLAWLAALYGVGAVATEEFDSYLHDAPVSRLPSPVSRRSLSWWALLEMAPHLSSVSEAWSPPSVFIESQGLAVLRIGGRYMSLECGGTGGGHGHPDRLNLTVHADGLHWLPDFGTGSYVARELFWYRSTLAHNAPRLDGVSQPPGHAVGEGFDEVGGWGWARGRFGDVRRTVVVGEHYLVDVVECAGRDEHTLELPWHFAGRASGRITGVWETGQLDDEFVSRVERRACDDAHPVVLELTAERRQLTAHFVFSGELLRATAPGAPGSGPALFYLQRAHGRSIRFVTVIEFGTASTVRAVRVSGDQIEIDTPAGVERHRWSDRDWQIEHPAGPVVLRGERRGAPELAEFLDFDAPVKPTATALRLDGAVPALDGTLAGFDAAEALSLDLEDQYRRSEEPYAGPEELRATALVNWDDDALYLAVDVVKSDLCFRPAAAPPLRLDNEPDDIHSDGVQVYLAGDGGDATGLVTGYVIVPESTGSGLRVRTVSDAGGDPARVRGAWRRTDDGYRITVAIPWSEGLIRHVGGRVGFDLIVNEMQPGRERRAGQLVWSGGNGWVWLMGDRQDAARFGVLELVG